MGATEGSKIMSTMVPMMCHTVEAAFQSARKRVGRKLISACRIRMTAQAHTSLQHTDGGATEGSRVMSTSASVMCQTAEVAF